jgi:hypothetical protein
MPAAPPAITPSWTPPAPSAPRAVSGNFVPGTPTAPRAISANFAPGSPAPPAAVSAGYQADKPGIRFTVEDGPEVDLVLVPSFDSGGNPGGWSSTGRGEISPGRYAAASTVGDTWTLQTYLDGVQDGGWFADGPGGEASPDLVASWSLEWGSGSPVLTATRGAAWPPIVGGSFAPSVPEVPAAISPGSVPGAPTAPAVVSGNYADPEPLEPPGVSDDFAPGAPAAPSAISASYLPATPSAPPAIST